MDGASESLRAVPTRPDMPMEGTLALAGVLAFALTAVTTQWLRADLDPLQATLSFYLIGPYGHWLDAAYWGLALSLVMLGAGYLRVFGPVAGGGLPALLFGTGAVALALVTLFPTDTAQGPPTLHGLIHGICAGTAFLCTGVAMLRLSWCLRRVPDWRRRAPLALALSALAFAALWLDVFWHLPVRGAEQKAVIVLYLLWLGIAARWLVRGPRVSRP